jgi:hypothetical protein
MAASPKEAVRNYLVALKNPSALRDAGRIEQLEQRLAKTNDALDRVRLRQQIIDAQQPAIDRFEEDFVTHAKGWADEHGVSATAFAEEGVPTGVLRKAGFSMAGRRARRGSARPGRVGGAGPRVSADEVRRAIPRASFTTRQLKERTGASLAVVRKVIQEEEAAGRVVREGSDPSHAGPGRAPTLYRRAKD